MGRLAIEVAPRPDEAAYGFLLRALAANGANARELMALTRGSTRRHMDPMDANLFAALTGIEEQWFIERIAAEARGDRWVEIEVFGTRWRNDWTLRGQHCQVCPQCLLQHGFVRLEWDLTAYVACPLHGRLLVDRCRACGRALLPTRPAVDICGCGRFIADLDNVGVDPAVVEWCRWLSKSLLASLDLGAAPALLQPRDLAGLSPDGAFRMIVALGGGTRELRGAHLNSASPWLGTSSVHAVLCAGLATLQDLQSGRKPTAQLGLGCGDALSEQSVRGIAAFDRHAAASMLAKLKLRSRWRNVRPVVHEQGDLFEGWS